MFDHEIEGEGGGGGGGWWGGGGITKDPPGKLEE